MGNTIAFDTHAYVKKLREAGVDERQAEIQAEALVDLVEDRLATKKDAADLRRDIEMIRADLQRDIAQLRADLQRDLKELELRMVIKTGGMILAGIGLLFGLLRAWPLPVQYVPAAGQEMRYVVPQSAVPPIPGAPHGLNVNKP